MSDSVLSALTTVIRMNDKGEAMAGLMKEQQRRIDDLHGRVIRLETVIEMVLHRSALPCQSLSEADEGGGLS